MTTTAEEIIPIIELGQSIPPDTPHAVSVSLPTWKSCVGYEEGEDWVLSKMKHAYPRFYIHQSIAAFAYAILLEYGRSDEQAILFPSSSVANRCIDFLIEQSILRTLESTESQKVTLQRGENVRLIDLVCESENEIKKDGKTNLTTISAVIFAKEHYASAKTFWQHSGDGVSSRKAEFYHKAFEEGYLKSRGSSERQEEKAFPTLRGPRRYQKVKSVENSTTNAYIHTLNDSTIASLETPESTDCVQFLEERFGRNLDISLAANAKLAIRRRITGSLTANVDLKEALHISTNSAPLRKISGFSEKDVYLYPSGMSSIFNTHRVMLAAIGSLKSISYGFPYIDTLKILQKWGPGCLFYGHGSSSDLNDLETRCKNGEKFLALFCEFPGNPLLKCPDLQRIRSLADRYDFAVVVDETVGNFINVHVLPFADVIVSSLTKVFSGDSNVMGGCAVLNPNSRYYKLLRDTLDSEYEDNYWAEDAVFMERNSRDFVPRIERINVNAEAICHILKRSPLIKGIHYPKYSPTRPFYDACRNPNGGYGGLFSVTFYSTAAAVIFFDSIEIAKGPSLGTNFTLCSPYTLLAHYGELDWAAQFGVEADLVRVSVGLEGTNELVSKFERVLALMDGQNGGI